MCVPCEDAYIEREIMFGGWQINSSVVGKKKSIEYSIEDVSLSYMIRSRAIVSFHNQKSREKKIREYQQEHPPTHTHTDKKKTKMKRKKKHQRPFGCPT